MADEVQIAKLMQAAAAIDEEIRQERAKQKALLAKAARLRRQADTRTKIIYGSALLRFLDRLRPEDRDRMLRAVEKMITRQADRVFLGLDPETDPARILATASLPSRQGAKKDLPFPT